MKTKIPVKKKASRTVLSRKELVAIAKLAKLSNSTLTKWQKGEKPVRPETELKIIKATAKYFDREVNRLKDHLEKLDEVEVQIANTKNNLQLAVNAMERVTS